MAVHSQATKKKALDLVAAGETRAHAARVVGVDVTTLKRWEKEKSDREAQPISSGELALVGGSDLALKGVLSKILAEEMPKGSATEVYQAIMMQKLAKALDGMEIPKISKMSDVKTIVALANTIMGVGGAKKNTPVSVSLRLDRLDSRPLDVVEAEVVADEDEDE